MLGKGKLSTASYRIYVKKLVFSLCQLTATSFVTDDGGRTTVYSNMDDRIRGILTSIRALGSAVPGV